MAATAAARRRSECRRRGEARRSLWLFLGASHCAVVRGQFGGAGYEPPAPICRAFSCPAYQVAVEKEGHQIWSYGCKDSGMGIYNMGAGGFDPNNPTAGMGGQKNLNKCCVERDICKQTCGMTSKACHDNFQKCTKKICKGDQNCGLQAMMADIQSDPYDPDEDKEKKYDPEESKCKAYKKGQADACECVPKDDFKSATERHLKSFYGKFNPEKLDDMGDIKDVEEVWKKWKGKEPDMFMALATKYKDKAVDIREKPKPPPYKPYKAPKADEADGPDGEAEEGELSRRKRMASEEDSKPAEPLDPEEITFKEQRAALLEQKRTSVETEEYDKADEAKEAIQELVQAEEKRLQAKKTQAIADEDFLAAKRIKQRIAKLSEL